MSNPSLPTLFVEGSNDVSLISGLLKRHGVDTMKGHAHLKIQVRENFDGVRSHIADAIRASTDQPVGFVVDIDVRVTDRWRSICEQLRIAKLNPPKKCPVNGYIGRVEGYKCDCGVWLMPDCKSDFKKMEDLVATLVPDDDKLWMYARECVDGAKVRDQRFRDVDRCKVDIHTWLAWQLNPGSPIGAAVVDRILRHDSPQAIVFLRWLKRLYNFEQLTLSESGGGE